MNYIVANNIVQDNAGFGTDTNIVTIIKRDGTIRSLESMSKRKVGHELFKMILSNE